MQQKEERNRTRFGFVVSDGGGGGVQLITGLNKATGKSALLV